MYPRGSNNGYGQDQPYSSQSSYAPQSLGSAALMGGVHGRSPAAVTVPPPQHYGGEYGSMYGSATQQVSPLSMKGSATTAFDGRSNYGSSMPESPKFAANDYITSSSRGYGQKVDKLYSERTSEYPLVERGQYGDRHSTYQRRESETTNRYTELVAIGREHQSKLYDHLEQATARQEEFLNARALQSASVEGGARQADYLASRAAIRHPAQDPIAYGGRLDHELRSLSMLTGPSYVGTHTASILGAAPQRNIDDLIYAQGSSTPGYGVSLPPGRDYRIGKGLLPIESDYPTNMLGHVGHLIVDDRKTGRATYGRDLERQDKDWDYLRERGKDREREKERLRERERERDRERLREREREREREKERERERERRERDRDRDHKRRLELKRELTPIRASRDRQASSLPKDIRSVRRESPHHEVLHRLHSPVKEKRREYSCKVYSYSFVESERDYLSLDKRYPRLYVSPECSKVVVHWPKSNLQLSLYTPVSFEHDFVEDATAKKDSPPTQPPADISGAGGRQTTVWNAKIILMSGLGQNAQAEMLSERTYDDRIPHLCNLLRFAVLRKNNSLMAIGGPWDTVDGGDPSVDDSSLVQTAQRYAKDVANLDLKNCQYWNRFLEIHYDRVGKDGLFSHKEVTVLFVPDLSNCLPSLDSWREQWFNHKKAVSERERLHAMAKEVPGDKKESSKDKKKPEQPKDGKAEIELLKKKALSLEHPKDGMVKLEVQKRKEAIPPGQSGNGSKKESDTSKLKREAPLVSEEGKEKDKAVDSNDVVMGTEKYKTSDSNDVVIGTEAETNVPEQVPEGNPDGQAPVAAKTGKKKIIKRIVKRKVAKKKNPTENVTEQNDGTKMEATEGEGNCVIPEADGQQDGPSNSPVQVKTLRIAMKTVKDALVKDEGSILEVKAEKAPEGSAPVTEDITTEDSNVVVEEGSTKTTVKKKVVKRVPKRKAPSPAGKVAEDDLKGEKITQSEVIKREQNEEPVEKQVMDISSKSSNSQKIRPHKKEEVKVDEKGGSAMEIGGSNQDVSASDTYAKSKERKETKDVKERKDRVENESKSKTDKTTKEKKKSDEPPKHPGLIFQTKGSKISKVHSSSLSLDSLLDYTDKDIDESIFELSVFAESFYEMLQYEMGCRLLAFLQKLRIRFVTNRNKVKRQRDDTTQKENEDSSLKKRARAGNTNEDVKSKKTGNNSSVDLKSNKTENKSSEDVRSTKAENETDAAAEDTRTKNTEVPNQDNVKTIKEETKSVEQVEADRVEDEIEEDPEEDPEEDEQLTEESIGTEKNPGDSIGHDVPPVIEQKEQQDIAKQASETSIGVGPSGKHKSAKLDSKPKETRAVNKKLLQAFRFFDRNRAGYVRVEDLRLIIHNLGKFLSHRDVKELVQSALLESSTGRDDRILYEKLVKMPDMM